MVEIRSGAARQELESGMQDTVSKLAQAALIIGMHDVLVAHGIRPRAVGGLSLGSRISAYLAGSVSRSELFAMLHHERLVPPPAGPPQGLAALVLPQTDDPAEYYGPRRSGIHLACDHGPARDGECRRVLVGGYLDALADLSKALPPESFRMLELYEGAYHTPLAGHFTDFMTPYIARMTFNDPLITLAVPNEQGPLTTADQVRTSYIEHGVTSVRMDLLLEQMAEAGVQTVITLGPGLAHGLSVAPMELIRIREPGNLSSVLATLGHSGEGAATDAE
ncbi:hypothetical protein [Rhodococcus oryzae]|uniref:hypothetical protein n=1 Tax=Rhodococcus oryzae TaxID=2571143 RepID=UPI0037A259DF